MEPPHLLHCFADSAPVGNALRVSGRTVAVAESCTGGLLAAALTAAPGSSDYVRGGVVAYHNDIKIDLLGVDAEVLRRDGAVSESVARQMAEGARSRCHADIGVGVTGIAGPAADGSSKPVGLIFVAVSGPGSDGEVSRLEGDSGREANRAAAVAEALRMLARAAG